MNEHLLNLIGIYKCLLNLNPSLSNSALYRSPDRPYFPFFTSLLSFFPRVPSPIFAPPCPRLSFPQFPSLFLSLRSSIYLQVSLWLLLPFLLSSAFDWPLDRSTSILTYPLSCPLSCPLLVFQTFALLLLETVTCSTFCFALHSSPGPFLLLSLFL